MLKNQLHNQGLTDDPLKGVNDPFAELLKNAGLAPATPQNMFDTIAPPQAKGGVGGNDPLTNGILADQAKQRAASQGKLDAMLKAQQAERARQQALALAAEEARIKAAEKETKAFAKNPKTLVDSFTKSLLESDNWKNMVSMERDAPEQQKQINDQLEQYINALPLEGEEADSVKDAIRNGVNRAVRKDIAGQRTKESAGSVMDTLLGAWESTVKAVGGAADAATTLREKAGLSAAGQLGGLLPDSANEAMNKIIRKGISALSDYEAKTESGDLKAKVAQVQKNMDRKKRFDETGVADPQFSDDFAGWVGAGIDDLSADLKHNTARTIGNVAGSVIPMAAAGLAGAGPKLMVAMNASSVASGQANEVRSGLQDATFEQLAKAHPEKATEYLDKFKGDTEKAKKALIDDAVLKGSLAGAAGAALLHQFGVSGVISRLAGKKGASVTLGNLGNIANKSLSEIKVMANLLPSKAGAGLLAKGAGTVVGGALSEGGEEGLEQLLSNYTVDTAGVRRNLTDGMVQSVAMGMLAGGPFSTVEALSDGRNTQKSVALAENLAAKIGPEFQAFADPLLAESKANGMTDLQAFDEVAKTFRSLDKYKDLPKFLKDAVDGAIEVQQDKIRLMMEEDNGLEPNTSLDGVTVATPEELLGLPDLTPKGAGEEVNPDVTDNTVRTADSDIMPGTPVVIDESLEGKARANAAKEFYDQGLRAGEAGDFDGAYRDFEAAVRYGHPDSSRLSAFLEAYRRKRTKLPAEGDVAPPRETPMLPPPQPVGWRDRGDGVLEYGVGEPTSPPPQPTPEPASTPTKPKQNIKKQPAPKTEVIKKKSKKQPDAPTAEATPTPEPEPAPEVVQETKPKVTKDNLKKKQPVAEPARDPNAKMSESLGSTKPRHYVDGKAYTPTFDNDIDKASYIARKGGTKSKRDEAYVKFASDATGMTEEQVREHGDKVAKEIETAASAKPSGGNVRVAPVYTAGGATKTAPKVEPTPAPKPEPKPEPKVEPTPAPKVEPKVEAKPEPKAKKGAKKTNGIIYTGKTGVVYYGDQKVEVEYAVVDASDLKKGIGSLQVRDRTAAESDLQIDSMAKNLAPDRLMESTEVSSGAPIIGPDKIVESGNGRVAAINRVYSDPALAKQASAYYDAVTKAAGVDLGDMDDPVFVRVRKTKLSDKEREAFTNAGNTSDMMALNPGEQAKVDSQGLTTEVLAKYKQGPITSTANAEFVSSFIAALPPQVQNAYATNGELSIVGRERLKNAMAYRAYGSEALLDSLTVAEGDASKQVLAGIQGGAAPLALLKDLTDPSVAKRVGSASVGREYDITSNVAEAALISEQIRRTGLTPSDWLRQDTLEGRDPITEAIFAGLFTVGDTKTTIAPGAVIDAFLNEYADSAQGASSDMFGETASPLVLLKAAIDAHNPRSLLNAQENSDLFTEQSSNTSNAGETAVQEGGNGSPTVTDVTNSQPDTEVNDTTGTEETDGTLPSDQAELGTAGDATNETENTDGRRGDGPIVEQGPDATDTGGRSKTNRKTKRRRADAIGQNETQGETGVKQPAGQGRDWAAEQKSFVDTFTAGALTFDNKRTFDTWMDKDPADLTSALGISEGDLENMATLFESIDPARDASEPLFVGASVAAEDYATDLLDAQGVSDALEGTGGLLFVHGNDELLRKFEAYRDVPTVMSYDDLQQAIDNENAPAYRTALTGPVSNMIVLQASAFGSPSLTPGEMEDLDHEVGHMILRQSYNQLPREAKTQIIRNFKSFAAKNYPTETINHVWFDGANKHLNDIGAFYGWAADAMARVLSKKVEPTTNVGKLMDTVASRLKSMLGLTTNDAAVLEEELVPYLQDKRTASAVINDDPVSKAAEAVASVDEAMDDEQDTLGDPMPTPMPTPAAEPTVTTTSEAGALKPKDDPKYKNSPWRNSDTLFVASPNVPKAQADYVKGLIELLGLQDTPLVMATREDLEAENKRVAEGVGQEENLFVGTYSDIISDDSVRSNRRIQPSGAWLETRNGPDGRAKYAVLVPPAEGSQEKMVEAMAHEVGHLLERQVFMTAPRETRDAVMDEYDAWFKKQTQPPVSTEELIDSLRNRFFAESTNNNFKDPAQRSMPFTKVISTSNIRYLLSFDEWFADNVSRWATTAEKPLTLVDKFFAGIAKALRKLAQAVTGKQYLPNKAMAEWLATLGPPEFTAEEIVAAVDAPIGAAGFAGLFEAATASAAQAKPKRKAAGEAKAEFDAKVRELAENWDIYSDKEKMSHPKKVRDAVEAVLAKDDADYKGGDAGGYSVSYLKSPVPAKNSPWAGTGKNFVATPSVDEAQAKYTEELLNLVGLQDVPVVLASRDDLFAYSEGKGDSMFNGRYRTAISPSNIKVYKGLADSTALVFINYNKDRTINYAVIVPPRGDDFMRNVEAIAHEVGHLVEKQLLAKSSPATKSAVVGAYNNWYKEQTAPGVSTADLHNSRSTRFGATRSIASYSKRMDVNAPFTETMTPDNIKYLTSFDEWFADNVARWATTSEKPLTIVDKFFSTVANALRKLAQAVTGKKYLPNEAVANFLDKLGPPSFTEEALVDKRGYNTKNIVPNEEAAFIAKYAGTVKGVNPYASVRDKVAQALAVFTFNPEAVIGRMKRALAWLSKALRTVATVAIVSGVSADYVSASDVASMFSTPTAKTAIVAPASVNTVPNASPEVNILHAGVVAKNASGGKPYIIADKRAGQVLVFNPDHSLRTTTPALFGRGVGDTANTKNATPAGMFSVTAAEANNVPGTVYVLNDTNGMVSNNKGQGVVAFHTVIEDGKGRKARLASETASDNAITAGCINLPNTFIDKHMGDFDTAPVFIIPDKADFREVFKDILPADRDTSVAAAMTNKGLSGVRFVPQGAGVSLPRLVQGSAQSSQKMTITAMRKATMAANANRIAETAAMWETNIAFPNYETFAAQAIDEDARTRDYDAGGGLAGVLAAGFAGLAAIRYRKRNAMVKNANKYDHIDHELSEHDASILASMNDTPAELVTKPTVTQLALPDLTGRTNDRPDHVAAVDHEANIEELAPLDDAKEEAEVIDALNAEAQHALDLDEPARINAQAAKAGQELSVDDVKSEQERVEQLRSKYMQDMLNFMVNYEYYTPSTAGTVGASGANAGTPPAGNLGAVGNMGINAGTPNNPLVTPPNAMAMSANGNNSYKNWFAVNVNDPMKRLAMGEVARIRAVLDRAGVPRSNASITTHRLSSAISAQVATGRNFMQIFAGQVQAPLAQLASQIAEATGESELQVSMDLGAAATARHLLLEGYDAQQAKLEAEIVRLNNAGDTKGADEVAQVLQIAKDSRNGVYDIGGNANTNTKEGFRVVGGMSEPRAQYVLDTMEAKYGASAVQDFANKTVDGYKWLLEEARARGALSNGQYRALTSNNFQHYVSLKRNDATAELSEGFVDQAIAVLGGIGHETRPSGMRHREFYGRDGASKPAGNAYLNLVDSANRMAAVVRDAKVKAEIVHLAQQGYSAPSRLGSLKAGSTSYPLAIKISDTSLNGVKSSALSMATRAGLVKSGGSLNDEVLTLMKQATVIVPQVDGNGNRVFIDGTPQNDVYMLAHPDLIHGYSGVLTTRAVGTNSSPFTRAIDQLGAITQKMYTRTPVFGLVDALTRNTPAFAASLIAEKINDVNGQPINKKSALKAYTNYTSQGFTTKYMDLYKYTHSGVVDKNSPFMVAAAELSAMGGLMTPTWHLASDAKELVNGVEALSAGESALSKFLNGKPVLDMDGKVVIQGGVSKKWGARYNKLSDATSSMGLPYRLALNALSVADTHQAIPSVAMYMALKDQGVSASDAAVITRSFFDPETTSAFVAKLARFFPFLRAAVAGSVTTARTLFTPTGLGIAAGVFAAGVAALYVVGSLLGDDEDGEPWILKLPPEQIIAKIPVAKVSPREGGVPDFVSVPVSQGIVQVGWAMAVVTHRMIHGRASLADATEIMTGALAKNVLAGQLDPTSASNDNLLIKATPTAFKSPARAMSGFNNFGDEAQLPRQAIDKTRAESGGFRTPEAYKAIAQGVYEATRAIPGYEGFDAYPESYRTAIEGVFAGWAAAIPGLLADREDKTGGGTAGVRESLGAFGSLGVGMVLSSGETAVTGEFYNARKDAKKLFADTGVNWTQEGEKLSLAEKTALATDALADKNADQWQIDSAMAYMEADYEIQKKNTEVVKKVKDMLATGLTLQDPEIQGLLYENYNFAADYQRRVYQVRRQK